MRGRVEPVPAISLLGGACMSYTFSLSRRSLPVRCLCLLLIVLVLWCFFMVPRAGAVALEATTIAYGGLLVGTILVGAGVVFSSHGDMVKVGNAMYKTLVNGSSAIGKTISSISAWAVEHGTSLAKGALRVGKDLYQGIVDAFNTSYSGGAFNIADGAVTLADGADNASCLAAAGAIKDLLVLKQDCTLYIDAYSEYGEHIQQYHSFIYSDSGLTTKVVDCSTGRTSQSVLHYSDYNAAFWKVRSSTCGISYGHSVVSFAFWTSEDGGGTSYTYRAPLSVSYAVAIPQPDLKYPSDDYLVRMPDIPSVDTATGDVTYPNDTAYTKDVVAVPYPVDTESVKVPDIPFDKPVDKSTGKTMDGTDTGTDTDNPSKPGEGADTGSNTGLLQKILDLLKNFFDSPSDFRLNMDGFRNLAIKDKFPFCIPFDMVDSVKQFAADAADYQFRVKLDTQYFKVDHVVDLTPLAVPLAFFRYLVVAWFAWVLMSRTHDLMKW